MSDTRKDISGSRLGRHIGVTYKTAWYVTHRIRNAMWEAKDIHCGELACALALCGLCPKPAENVNGAMLSGVRICGCLRARG